jgi:hypothetical protein
MQALLRVGELLVGDQLYWDEGGNHHVAVVRDDGRLEINGQVKDSPSTAARVAAGYEKNGWEAWTCERDGLTLDAKRRRAELDQRR